MLKHQTPHSHMVVIPVRPHLLFLPHLSLAGLSLVLLTFLPLLTLELSFVPAIIAVIMAVISSLKF